MSLKAIG
jgi:hypothetical protein